MGKKTIQKLEATYSAADFIIAILRLMVDTLNKTINTEIAPRI